MRKAADLASPEAVGRYAAERALSRLKSRKIATTECPVLFESPMAAGLLGALVQAVSGGALYRKSSFLLNSLGKMVLPKLGLLEGVLAGSPNLTRGNISSRTAMTGSLGLFQFSAPIQPGSSGGPVVSDGGELLGITVGTLNLQALVRNGVLPQNVNFALDARYAAQFMTRNHIDFRTVKPGPKGDAQTANAAALSTVVQLSCYQ
jgi:hypothetical protein